MYVPRFIDISQVRENIEYLPWLVSFCVICVVIILLIIVIVVLCSTLYKKNGKYDVSKLTGEEYVVESSGHQCHNMVENIAKRKSRILCFSCFGKSSTEKKKRKENKIGVKPITNGDITKRISVNTQNLLYTENSLLQCPVSANGNSEHGSGRLSCIDRELPPLPLLAREVFENDENNGGDGEISEGQTSHLSSSPPLLATAAQGESQSPPRSVSPTSTPVLPSPQTSHDAVKTDSNVTTPYRKHSLQSPFDRQLRVCSFCGGQPEEPSVASSDSRLPDPGASGGSNSTMVSPQMGLAYDYDPTYAVIRRSKHLAPCPRCGCPITSFTPAVSNRNSSLSLQQHSGIGPPPPSSTEDTDETLTKHSSFNDYCTYASIYKPKELKRQRSISQTELALRRSQLPLSLLASGVVPAAAAVRMSSSRIWRPTSTAAAVRPSGTISIWSLKDSHSNSPVGRAAHVAASAASHALIPDRNYGRSVIDLVQQLRLSNQTPGGFENTSFLTDDHLDYDTYHTRRELDRVRSCTPTVLLQQQQRLQSSEYNESGTVSPEMYQQPSTMWGPSPKLSVYSPLRIFDYSRLENQSQQQNDEDDDCGPLWRSTLGPMQKFMALNSLRKGVRTPLLFEPQLTPPPLSPMDSGAVIDDHEMADLDLEDGNKNNFEEDHYGGPEDGYDSLSRLESKDIPESQADPDTQILPSSQSASDKQSRVRPLSFSYYTDDHIPASKRQQTRSSVAKLPSLSLVSSLSTSLPGNRSSLQTYSQMSPLMEQSLLMDDSSSPGNCRRGSQYCHSNQLMSSEGSCAKSPLSNEPSPCTDHHGDGHIHGDFGSNTNKVCAFIWSGGELISADEFQNSTLDDYETLE